MRIDSIWNVIILWFGVPPEKASQINWRFVSPCADSFWIWQVAPNRRTVVKNHLFWNRGKSLNLAEILSTFSRVSPFWSSIRTSLSVIWFSQWMSTFPIFAVVFNRFDSSDSEKTTTFRWIKGILSEITGVKYPMQKSMITVTTMYLSPLIRNTNDE